MRKMGRGLDITIPHWLILSIHCSAKRSCIGNFTEHTREQDAGGVSSSAGNAKVPDKTDTVRKA